MTEATFRARAFPSVALAAGATFVVAGVLNTAGVFSEVAIHWTNWLIGFAFAAVAIAIVFGVFVRRASRSPDRAWRTGLVLGVLGVLTVWAYWSGLPPIFGFGAIYLGLLCRQEAASSKARRLGVGSALLGIFGLTLYVVIYVGDIATRV